MHLKKIFIATALLVMMSNSYAIEVDVQSNYSQLDGIGFTVNGAEHGGMGNSYKGSNMPAGAYKFGLRVNGKNVGCTSRNGKKVFKLSRNTNARLNFDGRKCIVNL